MITDARNTFCEGADITASTGTQAIGDVIDLGAPRDLGQGQPLYLVVVVTENVTGGSVEFVVASDASSSIATDGSASEHAGTGAQPAADMNVGTTLVVPLGTGTVEYERYLGVLQKTTSNTINAGKVDAFLTMDPTGWKAYPDALEPIT
jgi:hypothetical protein